MSPESVGLHDMDGVVSNMMLTASPPAGWLLSPASIAKRYGRYCSRLEMTVRRFEVCDEGGSRLCFLSASLTTPRYVLALRGNEGWESQLKDDEKEKAEVVGRTNGNGIFERLGPFEAWKFGLQGADGGTRTSGCFHGIYMYRDTVPCSRFFCTRTAKVPFYLSKQVPVLGFQNPKIIYYAVCF